MYGLPQCCFGRAREVIGVAVAWHRVRRRLRTVPVPHVDHMEPHAAESGLNGRPAQGRCRCRGAVDPDQYLPHGSSCHHHLPALLPDPVPGHAVRPCQPAQPMRVPTGAGCSGRSAGCAGPELTGSSGIASLPGFAPGPVPWDRPKAYAGCAPGAWAMRNVSITMASCSFSIPTAAGGRSIPGSRPVRDPPIAVNVTCADAGHPTDALRRAGGEDHHPTQAPHSRRPTARPARRPAVDGQRYTNQTRNRCDCPAGPAGNRIRDSQLSPTAGNTGQEDEAVSARSPPGPVVDDADDHLRSLLHLQGSGPGWSRCSPASAP